jgi:hypothetical protein
MDRLAATIVVLALTSCADSDKPVALGPDTFSVSALAANSRGGIAGARTIATREAGQHCQSRGQQILVTNIETGTSSNGGLGTATVTFRCLAEGDPELRRPNYQRAPDVIVETRK